MAKNSVFSGVPDQFPPLKVDLWSLIFPVDMGISEKFEVKAARPKVTNEVKEVKYKNSIFKYRGTTKFGSMQIEFRDVVGYAVMSKLWLWQRQHYDPATGCAGLPSQYKKELILYMEDDCGNPVQCWILHGAFIEELDGGSLDMDSTNEVAKVTMTLAYDWAENPW